MANKVPVTINGIQGEVEAGTTLLKAAKEIGTALAHICLGNGFCSTCRVRVTAGANNLSPIQIKERVSLDYHLCFDENVRLACQCTVVAPDPAAPAKPATETLEVFAPKPFSYLAFGARKVK